MTSGLSRENATTASPIPEAGPVTRTFLPGSRVLRLYPEEEECLSHRRAIGIQMLLSRSEEHWRTEREALAVSQIVDRLCLFSLYKNSLRSSIPGPL